MNPRPKRLPIKEFKYIYGRVPRLCVDLIIRGKRGVILSKRDIPPAKGKWYLPGGTLLNGEKLTESVKRIAEEETGLSLKIKGIQGIIEFSPKSVYGHSVSIAFLTTPAGGKLRGSWQAKEIDFFKRLPPNAITEHKNFLLKNKLIK